MKLKLELIQIFLRLKNMVANQFQTKIKRFQFDWDGKFRPLQNIFY